MLTLNKTSHDSLQAALRYARRGLAVIAIQAPELGKSGTGKAPLTAHGYLDGTTDEEAIEEELEEDMLSVEDEPDLAGDTFTDEAADDEEA